MLRFPLHLHSNFKIQKLSPLQHHHQIIHNLQLPIPLSNLQPTKHPNKTLHFHLQNLKFQSPSPLSMSSSSWSCSKCTFLNPSSQKFTCQICNTPSILPSQSPSSSSNFPHEKWACKACTFLNSYSNSNCEVCDSRASLPNFQDLDFIEIDDFDDDLGGSSSVGTVFFPLRQCNSGRVKESGDLGFQEKGQTQLGSHQFVDQGVNLSFNKGNMQEMDFENADAISPRPAKKEKNDTALKSVASAKIVDNAQDNVSFKRKLCDLGDFVDEPNNVDSCHDMKSSRKKISITDSVKDSSIDKVGNIKTSSDSVSIKIAESAEVKEVPGVIKILSYNVWFVEELEVHRRMEAIGDLIELHSPDVICFQEVTHNIYAIFQNSAWWKKYRCSISNIQDLSQPYFCMQLAKLPVKSFSSKPFSYSAMSRELAVAELEVNKNKSLVVATSHLESPCPGPPTWDQFYSKERVNQAKDAVKFLQNYPNVIFCGDMNWDDSRDGRFPLVEGWVDAWEKLRPAEIGFTYDTKANKMLTGNRSVRKRLDRFICCLSDFEIRSIDMIGTEEIYGLTYKKNKKLKNKIQELILPVFPSDHFGLVLTISSS